MQNYYITGFSNHAEQTVTVAVEPWAMAYDVAPQQTVTVETIYDENLEVAEHHVSDFICNADGSVTLQLGPAWVRSGAETELLFPAAVRITLPDRTEIYGDGRRFAG